MTVLHGVAWLQPLEVLRVGMKREFMVVEDEDEYDQVILSLAAQEVRACSMQRMGTGRDAGRNSSMSAWSWSTRGTG